MEDTQTSPTPAAVAPANDPLRIQILATEHWSLLAQRSMIWNELFSRAAMFITVLSASTVALALVAQATDFNEEFHVFALLVLPVTLILGIGTLIRLGNVMAEDIWLIAGMNRLRHGYLDTLPDLSPYFIASAHDDLPGILQTRGPHPFDGPSHLLSATPTVVAVINAALCGVIAGLTASYFGTSERVEDTIGIVAFALATVVFVALVPRHGADRISKSYQPQFPSPDGDPVSVKAFRGSVLDTI